ncbi:hypothetical protein GGTG_11673 [Gaeumannomyces tritici R3-111a-1]|uniref:Phospholipid-binding protein n=1 Tax=Gaeumannomyces tritici (strain R3-111a-1) TaxID=644352 RepID=J3PDV0_GAET3|nr:hypothetical protein GGTG_11673 [Gaeumannomyces tritici R3-111a-1]EJT70650.1 hypothetical protein GGTG_11673 [Gaeumannomyces tritici R3-111a-1]
MATTYAAVGVDASDSDRPLSPSDLPPVPTSPTMSFASTTNPLSTYAALPPPPPPRPAHTVLTKADLDASQAAYSDLLSSAKAYRQALAALGTAASAFGGALEACARLKEARAPALAPLGLAPTGGASTDTQSSTVGGGGPPTSSMSASLTAHSSAPATAASSCTADQLLAAAGLQHLIANHQQILGETVYRSFEVPLLHELDKWRRDVDDEQASYEAAARTRGREIRRLEKEGLKLHRQNKRRDVAKFRGHLVELTARLDGLTVLHADHARALLRDGQDTSVKVLDAACGIARAEVDIFESLARKGWTGGGLEDLLERGADLFASDGDGASILADSASETTRPGHHRADSLLVDDDEPYQSLARALSSAQRSNRGVMRDDESFVSQFNQSRGVRPFSPQPQPVDPDELPMGSDSSGRTSIAGTPRPLSRIARGGDGNGDDDEHGQQQHEATLISPSPPQLEEPTPRASRIFKVLHHDGDGVSASVDGSEDGDPWRNERSPSTPAGKDGDDGGGPQLDHTQTPRPDR